MIDAVRQALQPGIFKAPVLQIRANVLWTSVASLWTYLVANGFAMRFYLPPKF